jgi:hypothetical protein
LSLKVILDEKCNEVVKKGDHNLNVILIWGTGSRGYVAALNILYIMV